MVEVQTQSSQPTDARDAGLTSGRFALVLGLLVILTFPGVLLFGQTFVFGDFGMFGSPLAHFTRESLGHGELPLWNPYNCCGLPFLAQWNTLALYPPSLIYILLPFPWSVSFFCLLHLFWGGLGMHFLAQRWTADRWAGAVAAVIFAFNGLTVHSLIWPNNQATWSWFPWVIWLTQDAWRAGGRRMVWATAAAALQMLAGGPEIVLLTWFILFVLACGDWIGSLRSGREFPEPSVRALNPGTSEAPESSPSPPLEERAGERRHFPPRLMGKRLFPPSGSWGGWVSKALTLKPNRANAVGPQSDLARQVPWGGPIWNRFFGIGLLVAMVCAAQLLPFLQLLAHSQRHTGYASSDWAMPQWGWANFLVPLFRTLASPQGVFFQEGQGWTNSYYAGPGAVWLAAIAVRRIREWRVRILAGFIFLGLVLALGNAGLLYPALRSALPTVGFLRYPVKFVLLVLSLAPLLAAFGLKSVLSRDGKLGRFEWGSALVLQCLIVGIIALDAWSPRPPGSTSSQEVLRNGALRSVFFVLIVVLTAWFVRCGGRQRTLSGCLLVLVFWFDFATEVPARSPTVHTTAFATGWARRFLGWNSEPRLGEGRAMIGPSSLTALQLYTHPNSSSEEPYLIYRLAMLPNCNLFDSVPLTHGLFSLVPREANDATLIPFVETNQDFSVLLDFMGVTKLTAQGKLSEWATRSNAMPLVTAGQQPVFESDRNVFWIFAQTNQDLRKIVFLPPDARSSISATNQVAAHILSAKFSNQDVSIQAEAPQSTLVVISQTYYPVWKAYVDGQPVKLWRANYAFQAVEMPAGQHRIRLRYEDRMFRIGVILSLVGIAFCVALWVRGATKERVRVNS